MLGKPKALSLIANTEKKKSVCVYRIRNVLYSEKWTISWFHHCTNITESIAYTYTDQDGYDIRRKWELTRLPLHKQSITDQNFAAQNCLSPQFFSSGEY
jgi:spore maturation protein CgeB